VIVELPFRRGHYYCLPILFRLYLNKKSALKHRRAYRTRPELAVEGPLRPCASTHPAGTVRVRQPATPLSASDEQFRSTALETIRGLGAQ
jgi:hypothetical protein